MRLSLHKKVVLALGAAMALLLAASGVTYRVAIGSRASERLVGHSHEVRHELQRVLASAQDIETGSRGFALTGMDEYLTPYVAGRARVDAQLAALAGVVAGDRAQRQHVAALGALIELRTAIADSLVRTRRARGAGAAEALARQGAGRTVMDEIRAVVRILDAQERQRLATRADYADASTSRLLVAIVAVTGLAVVLLAAFGWLIRADLRARLRAERALAQSEARFRDLLEAAPDAIVISDGEGRIQLVNRQAETLLGYDRAALVGQPVEILLPEQLRRGHAAQRGAYHAAPSTRPMGNGLELHGRRADGSEFPVEVSLSPMETDDGGLVIAAIRDVTRRREAERELARQKALLESILANVGDGVLAVDADGTFQLFNPAAERILGRGATSARVAEWYDAFGMYDRDARTRLSFDALPLVQALQGHEAYGVEAFIRTAEGEERDGRWISCTARPVRDEQGEVRGAVAAFRDVTAWKEAEAALQRQAEELARSNAELQQFAYVASHDLQEPLRMVASYTQLLAKRYQGRLDQDADEFIGFAVEGASRMQRLISDLLSYSRVGTRGKELRAVSSQAALARATANLQAALTEGAAVVRHGQLPDVRGDETQLSQLFQNLIANAIKFRGAEPPVVQISATADEGGGWLFSVRDNGIGIEPQYFDRIFGMFQRLHRSSEYPGSGIGLAICKRIVERHGGRMWVESTYGHGSTFHFTLPAVS